LKASGERLTFHQFHHQVIRANVIQRADVGMVQRGDGPSFPLEASTELLRANFDGDLTAKASVYRPINTAHGAGADRGFDLVRPKLRTGGQHGDRRIACRVSLRQQRLNFATQLDIALAGLVQKRAPPARLAFQGRVVELLDLLPAFRAYVQMSLRYAVFGVHGTTAG
jgi:hypothetical protein